jgi:hypothetical protein
MSGALSVICLLLALSGCVPRLPVVPCLSVVLAWHVVLISLGLIPLFGACGSSVNSPSVLGD